MNLFPYRAKFEEQDELCFVSIHPMPVFVWASEAQREEYEILMSDVMRPYQGMAVTPAIIREIELTVEDFLLELVTIGVIGNSLPFGIA